MFLQIIRNHVIKRQQTHITCRYYTTNSLKQLEDSNVVVVHGSDLKKKRNHPNGKGRFSRRLRSLMERKSWVRIPESSEYESKERGKAPWALIFTFLILELEPPNKVPVAKLAHGLDRVLFK